jgi:hypothetical protein
VLRRPRIEDFLVVDAASYLFDLGFNVITERQLGAGRLDIVEETLGLGVGRDALLIEAKIYKSVQGARAALKQGLAQLYGYATTIESSFRATENFLLVYRLGGPKVVLPRDDVVIGDYTFRVVHVDLATAKESGSRSRPPAPIDVAEIISAVKSGTARAGRRGARTIRSKTTKSTRPAKRRARGQRRPRSSH